MRRAVELRLGASPTPQLIDGGGRAGPALPQPLPGGGSTLLVSGSREEVGFFLRVRQRATELCAGGICPPGWPWDSSTSDVLAWVRGEQEAGGHWQGCEAAGSMGLILFILHFSKSPWDSWCCGHGLGHQDVLGAHPKALSSAGTRVTSECFSIV